MTTSQLNELAAMNDAPTLETDAAIVESNGQWSFTIREKMKKLERERNAARAEVEAMREAIREARKIIDVLYMDALDNHKESWPRAREWLEKRAAKAQALRLRPIAEAGPVPEGMIRLYAHRIPLGPPGAEFWSAFSETDEEDTHCLDVFPPAEAQEGQARP